MDFSSLISLKSMPLTVLTVLTVQNEGVYGERGGKDSLLIYFNIYNIIYISFHTLEELRHGGMNIPGIEKGCVINTQRTLLNY